MQSLVACPSTLQTCAAGMNACACPASACDPTGDTSCGSATSLIDCALDVPGGCGIYPASAAVACPIHQSCTGAAPNSDCFCTVDPFCSAGAGNYCNAGNTGTITCAVDTNACTFQNPPVLCGAPKSCTGAAPASACTCPPVTALPATGGSCMTLGATACETGGTNMILTCAPSGGCNTWQQTTSCAASSLLCGTRSPGGVAACECGANATSTFYADAVNGSVAGALPFPSGLQSPAQCRFRTLTTALALANAAAAVGPSANVIATGATSTVTVTFANETFPLVLQPNVTLSTTDVVQAPANYIVAFNAAGSSAFLLHDASTVTGMLLQQVSGAAGSPGVATTCPNSPAGPVRISNSLVNARPGGGGTSLNIGIAVTGACTATLTAVDLRNATNAGLGVGSSANATLTTVTNGTFDGNGVGIFINRGTLQLTNLVVRNSPFEGVLIAPALGEVIFTQTGGVIENNGREGLRASPGTGSTVASTVTITGTEYRNNGGSPGGGPRPGISINARPAVFTNVNVHDNVGGGLSVIAGGGAPNPSVDVSGNSHFDTNGTAGVAGNGASVGGGGSFTATAVTFNNNRGAGVHVGGGGTAALHGGSYNGNGAGSGLANGIEIESLGTVSIDRGAVVQNNFNSGIRTTGGGGVMTITGGIGAPIDVARNGLANLGITAGAWFANSTVTATNVAFHDNGRHGVLINNTGPNPIGAPISISNSTFTNNAGEGLRVEVSERTVTNTNSLNVINNVFTGSLRGIDVAPNAGLNQNVWALFQGNVITGHVDTGIYINGTANSNLTFTANTIVGNRVAPASVFGGFGAGGVVLTGTNPPSGRFSFLGNVVHHNLQNEILAASFGAFGVTWDLSGTAAPPCVPATANTFACYNGVNPATPFVGIQTVGATVIANGNTWQNPVAPTNGTDFASAGGGSVPPPIANCPPSAIPCP